MSNVVQRETLVEVPREGFGPLAQFVPDTPWTTTTLQAIQNRKASVYVDQPQHPRNLVIFVPGGDGDNDHDQAYVFGLPNSEGLRSFVASITRATEFIVDEELAPMIQEIHPDAKPREAMCCWFDRLELPPAAATPVPVRRLRAADAEAAARLIPAWTFRTFASPKDMILGGGCFGIEANGELASVAYVADQSVKHARIAAFTAEKHRRHGYAFVVMRKLMELVANDGRLVCALAPRRNAAAVHFALKLGFAQKALLRTYKVRPAADTSPLEITSSTTTTLG